MFDELVKRSYDITKINCTINTGIYSAIGTVPLNTFKK